MIGPTGLERVLTAIVAAATKPEAAPTATGQKRDASIQPRQRATQAVSGAIRTPPMNPPANRPVRPAAPPNTDPTKPPMPPRRVAMTNRSTFFTIGNRYSPASRRWRDRWTSGPRLGPRDQRNVGVHCVGRQHSLEWPFKAEGSRSARPRGFDQPSRYGDSIEEVDDPAFQRIFGAHDDQSIAGE